MLPSQRTPEEISEIEKRQQQLIDAAANGETSFNQAWEKMFPKSENPSPTNAEAPTSNS